MNQKIGRDSYDLDFEGMISLGTVSTEQLICI